MVVMSGGWVKNAAPSSNGLEMINNTANLPPRALLICRPNSHPFQERSLTLDQPVKIGRSVARARAVLNNAIFDCKVLSRNHALLWYENGKFYLQDTKSSNGTFVNNQRLSKGVEESSPREVCSGDIVQFGVDVMENTRKVTHGCIVATLKLYLPDGKEAKASPSTAVVSSVGMVPLEDLYQLNQYLQESLQRGQLFENKLAKLQHIVETMSQASELGWRALIDEDRLLSRVEILESQLQMYSKNFAEDKLREELRKLQEDKTHYQGTAKESLRKVLQEKLDALQKLQDLERSLSNAEEECTHLKNLCDQSKQDLQDLAQKYTIQLEKVEDLSSKLRETEDSNKEICEKLNQEKRDLQNRLLEQSETQHNLQLRLESLQGDGELSDNQLTTIQSNFDPVVKVESRVDLTSLKPTESTKVDIILERIDPDLTGEDNMKEVIQHTQSNIDILRSQICKSEAFIEEVKLEEDSCLELTHEIHHQILRLEREMNISKENNKNIKENEPSILNRLKDDMNKLEDILKETRNKKKNYEQKLANCQSELESAKILIKKTSELGNLLKDQLQQVQNQYNKRSDTLLKQQEQISTLEASEGLLKSETQSLKEKLEEEKANSEKIRQQLIETQQNAKQSHNEAEQMKDRLNAMKLELSNQNNKDVDCLATLQLQCSTLQEDNLQLKQRCLMLEQQNEKLNEDKISFQTNIQNEKSIKDDNSLIQLQLISLQEELVVVKQVYAQCNEEKTQLARHVAKLEQEMDSVSIGSISEQLSMMVPLFFVFIGFVIYYYPTISVITGTSEPHPG